jgi:adenylate kinase family enzyme
MRRVIVVGCQGSGKTRLSLALGRKLGLPVVHLDTLYWRPGWKASDTPSFRERVTKAVAGDGWIVDGSFSGLAFDLTLARAEKLIVIERSRFLCLWRVLWRSAFQRRGTRADLPDGCPEQFDFDLLKQVWRYNLDRRPRIEEEHLKYGANLPVVRLRSDREIAAFVEANSPAT